MKASRSVLALLASLIGGVARLDEVGDDYIAVRCSRLADVEPAMAIADAFERDYGWVVGVRF